jgi:hypothetical protein
MKKVKGLLLLLGITGASMFGGCAVQWRDAALDGAASYATYVVYESLVDVYDPATSNLLGDLTE